MGDGPPPRLAQRHQTRLSVAAAQAIDIDRGTGSQQSPAPPTGKSLKRKCIDASEGRRKIAKKSTQQDTSRMRKKKGETPPSPSGSPGQRCTHTAMHQQSDRGTRQTSIQEAMGKAAQRAQAGLPLLAHHQRQARLSRASLPNRGKTRQAATTGETLMAELADPGVAAPLSASESATQAAPPGLDPEACAPAPGPVGEFKVATFNCMGGTTAEGAIEALVQRDPDALVLTELKINSRQQRKNVYRKLLHRGYKITMSVLPGGSLLSHAGQPGRGKAGVLVAMAKRHTTHNSLTPQTVPAQLQGYLGHVRLTPPAGRPLDIIGVYLPSDADEQHTRRAAGTYISEISRACAQQGRTLVLAGDWNATLRNADRSTGSQHHVDTAHRELAATCQLAPAGGIPTDPTEPREPTYCQHVVGGQAVRSTIDDVLICLPTLPDEVTKWAPAPWQIPAAGGNSDHEPYEVRLPCSALGYVRPPPQTHVPFRSRTVFQQPMSIAELTGYRDAFEAAAHRGISCFARAATDWAGRLEQAHAMTMATTNVPEDYAATLQAKALHLGVPPTAVEELANQLHDLLAQALDTARQSCATRTTTDRHYLRRQASKKLRQLDKLTCLYKVGRRRLHAQPDIWHCAQAVLAALQAEMEAELGPVENTAEGPARGHGGKGMLCNATAQDVEEAMRTLREQLLTPPTATHPTPAGEPNAESAGHSQTAPATSMPTTPMSSVMTELQQRLHAIRMERRTLLRKDKLQSWERAAAAWRAKYARQPKWGHRDIANRDAA